MRNVINLNKNWAFIQQDAGLPEVMPTDWTCVDPVSYTHLSIERIKYKLYIYTKNLLQ